MMFTWSITLFGFIIAEMLLMAAGPKRDPERNELAVSNGAPAIAKSRPSAESSLGILIKVPMLQKRGDDNALAGCFTFMIISSSVLSCDGTCVPCCILPLIAIQSNK